MSNPVVPRHLDWTIPARLFDDGEAEYHHHMGLQRADTRQFYAPTSDHETLLAERRTILSSSEADRHQIHLAGAAAAIAEFAEAVFDGAEVADGFHADALPRQLGSMLEPDWLLLAPPEWRVVAVCVCFPTRWSLEGKASETLANIHGVVPQLNEEIGRKIATFFDRMKPGEGWERSNWGLSSNARLNQHPSLPYEPLREDHPFTQIQVRIEHQHLCKLARTGAMSFGIRVMNYPLAEVRSIPPSWRD